jgi:hypothetical protein
MLQDMVNEKANVGLIVFSKFWFFLFAGEINLTYLCITKLGTKHETTGNHRQVSGCSFS